MIHAHVCINHDPPLQWEHAPNNDDPNLSETPCLEPDEALCPECYEEQTRLNIAQLHYQAGTSYASGVFD